MNKSYTRWKSLFIFCLGLTLATGLCMQWIAADFRSGGEKFTMIGLEIFYSKVKIERLFIHLDGYVYALLNYHLRFDFILMAGVFPGITSFAMMVRERIHSRVLRKILFAVAFIQLLGWAGDVAEDLYLLKWLKDPIIRNEFFLYRSIVISKWLIGTGGFVVALLVYSMSLKQKSSKLVS